MRSSVNLAPIFASGAPGVGKGPPQAKELVNTVGNPQSLPPAILLRSLVQARLGAISMRQQHPPPHPRSPPRRSAPPRTPTRPPSPLTAPERRLHLDGFPRTLPSGTGWTTHRKSAGSQSGSCLSTQVELTQLLRRIPDAANCPVCHDRTHLPPAAKVEAYVNLEVATLVQRSDDTECVSRGV